MMLAHDRSVGISDVCRRFRTLFGPFLLLGLLLAGCAGVGVDPSAYAEFEEGLTLFNRGKYEDAAAHFQRATELDPEYSKAYLYLGRSYLNLGRFKEAVPPLRAAFASGDEEVREQVLPVLLDALFGVAGSELEEGDFGGSIETLHEALQLQPGEQRFLNRLAEAFIGHGLQLLEEGRAKPAIEAFQEALQLTPGDVQAYLGLAQAFYQSGQWFKALENAQKALKIDSANPAARGFMQKITSP